jgi:50S ribosomal protein L16 3-hydroxylase
VSREVFDAAVLAAASADADALPAGTQFTIERWQQTRPGAWLPRAADGSFDGYQHRLADQLDGRRYALVINRFHTLHHPQWTREREFYGDLWAAVGQPISGGITTMFHGTYEHSPVGVHKDRFATFMFALHGRKRMRFWPECPWTGSATTVLDYQPYVADSFPVEVEPGDLLYWPASYFHVGESVDDGPATSVNIGVPREGHRASYDLDDLLPETLPVSRSAALFTEHAEDEPLTDDLPAALAGSLARLVEYGGRLPDRTAELALRHRTGGGFRPPPPPAEPVALDDDAVVRAVAPIVVAAHDGGSLCAANGHVTRVATTADELNRALAPLRAGRAMPAGQLAGVRELLVTLESWHAISRDPD